jgi:Protein of unknown function (DUF3631)
MTKHRSMVRRFGDRERELLMKLFRSLGTDNPHEAEAARSRIASLLDQFDKAWTDLIALLSGGTLTVDATLAAAIVGLGDPNPDQRANSRRNISELLARHRKTWNDFADALCAIMSAPWLDPAAAPDPERENPLALLVFILREYVELRSEHEYVAVALWALHTHVCNEFMVTPRLALRSPTADCGKSTLLDILARETARPIKYDNVTAAALCHSIDESHPTVLLDEVDNLVLGLQGNGKIRALFNSGHRAGGTMAIWTRDGTRKFLVFAPLALALPDAIGGLPRTLNSRCVTITMQRSRRELRRLDVVNYDPAFDAIYRQILLWRRDVALNPDPVMPDGMRNRFADNWRPLLSIADTLDWGTQAREAMVHFAREFQDADVRILLLGDIRKVFDAQAVDRLPTRTLLAALLVLDETDWTEFRGVRGEQQPHKLKASELAAMLRDFQIRPRSIWPTNRTATSKSAKGYRRSQFEEVWLAYCGEDGTTAQASNIRSLRRT